MSINNGEGDITSSPIKKERMKKEYVRISQIEGKIQYLNTLFPNKKLPSHRIIRKKITGIGATYGELVADRNSIIIEPTVPVIKGKLEEHKDVCGVFEGVKTEDVIKYLSRRLSRYKFITTPESFYKIKDAMEEMEIDMYFNYFLLFDECERIIQDTAYRPNIALPLDDFFRFKEKAMVSATPIIPSDPRFEEQGFKVLEIKPDFSIQKDMLLVTTNCILDVFRELMEQSKVPKCIFLNSTDTIHAIIKQMGIEKESAVFCSQKSVTKLKNRGFAATYDQWKENKMKEYNFFTSRFYAAVDIKLPYKPDVIMITDLNYAEHSIIDPNTEAIQIPGRFRNGISNLVHITNDKFNYQLTTREELKGYLKGSEDVYNRIKLIYEYAVSQNLKEAFGNVLNEIPYAKLLYSDGSKNYFAIDNFIDEAMVKSFYRSKESILEAYQGSGMFNVVHQFKYLPLGDREKLNRERNMSMKERHKEVIRQLELLNEYDTDSVMKYRDELRSCDPFIVNAYEKIGKDRIEELNYSRPKIEEAIILKDYDEKTTGMEFFKLLDVYFHVGGKYKKKYIIDKFKHIFKVLNTKPKEKITSELLEKFFYVTPYRSGNNIGYYISDKK